MRFEFYYTAELDVVSHEVQMSIHEPFGEAIRKFCRAEGVRGSHWTFALGLPGMDWGDVYVKKITSVTPHDVGWEDDDVCQFYCSPKEWSN